MKKYCKILSLLGALALGSTILSAASSVESMRVNVPFEFVLAGKVLPAGEYTVEEMNTGLVLVQGSRVSALALTFASSPAKEGSIPALRFTASNGHEYLVAIDSESMHRTVKMHTVEIRALTPTH